MNAKSIETAYIIARDKYFSCGIDTDAAIRTLSGIALSLPCWQGDDVLGFETKDTGLNTGGIRVTGNYPGRARSIHELRNDLEKVYSLIPGNHRLNLHAIYGDFAGRKIDRDKIEVDHFVSWIDWAEQHGLKLDFNATCFSHPRAESGFTLSSKDDLIREFWIEHVKRCRIIAAFMGGKQGSPCIHNLWIPDGAKDITVDRWNHRSLLKDSLDRIFVNDFSPQELKDSIESKLFGIGSEFFVVGSFEFYLGYILTCNKLLCLDTGHFHPTESVADKLSAVLQFAGEVLLHLSRGIHWDSDHVVIFNDETRELMAEIVRCNVLERVHLALDYFDASINRIGAWVVGARATLKAMLEALLEPRSQLLEYEEAGDYFSRLALLEESKSLPLGAVWDYYCLIRDVPPGKHWVKEVLRYEKEVTALRK